MTKRVLITGGTGNLGQQLVPHLQAQGFVVRIMSRRASPAGAPTEWAQAHLATGQGLASAVQDVHTIIHAASAPFSQEKEVDIAGTKRLLAAASQAGVQHIVYISIVGIEKFTRFSYYQTKLAVEELISQATVPYSILRATQFHEFLDLIISGLSKIPFIMPIASDFKFQVIDVGEVAERMVEIVGSAPAGRIPDIGGPQILTMKELTQAWLAATGKRRLLLNLPLFGHTPSAYRAGHNTCPEAQYGTTTWQEWLIKHKRD